MAGSARWQPSLGAWPEAGGTRFRVWAPASRVMELVLERGDGTEARRLEPSADACFGGWFPDVRPGDRYRYRPDGRGPFPDPASRFQPDGVHGPSQVVDPGAFHWSDQGWKPPDAASLVVYELHVGTFGLEGTFADVTRRLADLARLGVTAIELMPVADFPGSRNWGYDGVDLFAPARCYGAPDDLRRLVDSAHALGLAVLLDVVYNHLGPDGAYVASFSPYYFSARHTSPWGAGVNLDGEHSEMVRAFFIENALHWLCEYHLDGLRLDATDAMTDAGSRPFLAEFSSRVRSALGNRPVLFVAEDQRNLAALITPEAEGGWGIDGVWADDFHHQMRRLLAGDSEGYYADFSGTTRDLATTIRQGWFFTGQHSSYAGRERGTDPRGIPVERFVVCLQNHDQVGNRARGDRLHHSIALAAYRAASLLLLVVSETPLLFMGQEWATASPFLYFTDHDPQIGRLVTEGRRLEFRHFSAFADEGARSQIPDPQAESTFTSSRLDWQERDREPHASVLRLYSALLDVRRSRTALQAGSGGGQAAAIDDHTIALYRESSGDTLLAVVRLRGSGTVNLGQFIEAHLGRPIARQAPPAGLRWQPLLTTEDPAFAPDPQPPEIDLAGHAPVIHFLRPSAVLLVCTCPQDTTG